MVFIYQAMRAIQKTTAPSKCEFPFVLSSFPLCYLGCKFSIFCFDDRLEAAMQRLTNLCSVLNDMEPICVLNHVFVLREVKRPILVI